MLFQRISATPGQPNTKTRGAGLAFLFLLTVSPVSAHDFWIQPQKFWLAVGTPTPVSLFVGHGDDKHLWDADIRRIVSVTHTGPRGTVDQMRAFQQGGSGTLSFNEPGFYMLALQTNSASSELPAIQFNAYLANEGLTPAIVFRQNNNQINHPGSEIYSRRAKLLLRVGNSSAMTSAYITKPLGLTLEIVPEQNPYTSPAAEPIPFRIYYEGRPLRGATVTLNNLRSDAEPRARAISDASGRVAFTLPRRDQWQVNVVWTKPLQPSSTAQFETIFSSLTFGFDPAPPS